MIIEVAASYMYYVVYPIRKFGRLFFRQFSMRFCDENILFEVQEGDVLALTETISKNGVGVLGQDGIRVVRSAP